MKNIIVKWFNLSSMKMIRVAVVICFATEAGTSAFVPAHGIRAVPQDDPKWQPGFAGLGTMFEAAGLIWSGVAPVLISQPDAIIYCAILGARLPTKEDYVELSRLMGSEQPIWGLLNYDVAGYNSDLVSDMNGRFFWSSSVRPNVFGSAFGFGGSSGFVGFDYVDNEKSVRCVW